MDMAALVQILDDAVCISHSANTHGKGLIGFGLIWFGFMAYQPVLVI